MYEIYLVFLDYDFIYHVSYQTHFSYIIESTTEICSWLCVNKSKLSWSIAYQYVNEIGKIQKITTFSCYYSWFKECILVNWQIVVVTILGLTKLLAIFSIFPQIFLFPILSLLLWFFWGKEIHDNFKMNRHSYIDKLLWVSWRDAHKPIISFVAQRNCLHQSCWIQ